MPNFILLLLLLLLVPFLLLLLLFLLLLLLLLLLLQSLIKGHFQPRAVTPNFCGESAEENEWRTSWRYLVYSL